MEKNKNKQQPNILLKHEREKRGWSQNRLGELIGADPTMISRWEHGGRNPERIYQEKLCELFNKNAIELGFIKQQETSNPTLTDTTSQNSSELPVQKKENTNVTPSPTILTFPIETLEDTNTLDRLQRRTLKEHSSIDETTLTLLETMNRNNWYLYAMFENSILYRRDMLYGISGQLQTITNLMEYSQPNLIHNRLSSFACDTMQLMGEIFFDLKDSNNAKKHYDTAMIMARENHNNLSLAITLGRMSFISMYDDDPQKALDPLYTALARLPQQAPDIIRVWLLTRLAETHAILYNGDQSHKDACLKALDNAELYLGRSQSGEHPASFSEGAINAHMNMSIFRGYQGACYTHLKLPTDAQRVLHADLASTDSTQDIHNAIVHVDLAKTYVQQKEIEEAYKYLNEALLITSRLKSARVLQRILTLLADLEPWKNTWYIKDLNEQMTLLIHSTTHLKKG